MGALHKGHVSLIDKCVDENDISIVSIFVNPTQFDRKEDFHNYPKTLSTDLELLQNLNVTYVFTPHVDTLYPEETAITIDCGSMATVMEGKYRKGHFEGVAMVVCKLLNIVQPGIAYFGLKDLQQYLIIKKLCYDLNFSGTIKGVETVRASNGLALSSRNKRLGQSGLEIAANLHIGLNLVKQNFDSGLTVQEAIRNANRFYAGIDGLKIEYLAVVNTTDLQPLESLEDVEEFAICVAGYVQQVRLIDNLYLRL